ncbi:FMN-dependent NADH-azoreductase [Paenibacillus rhizosphaerae]|uniref:FMN-dependent NADH-azoreductase n=1 Tax=Paenibacillus rhizosphaerae TaxID=297318 RepID=A0A839TU37_9BACL|nr:FMN-dependent NADH-azoreductase [Paenibacillus rhizosphaerae]
MMNKMLVLNAHPDVESTSSVTLKVLDTYTHSGSVGLLKDGRNVLVIQGSGSKYTNNNWYTEVEYSHQYLRSMFTFMGFDSYEIIRAQGNAVLPKETVLEQARQEAVQAAERFVRRIPDRMTR